MAKFIEVSDANGNLTLINADAIECVDYMDVGMLDTVARITLRGGETIVVFQGYHSVVKKLFAPDMEGSLLTEDEEEDMWERHAKAEAKLIQVLTD